MEKSYYQQLKPIVLKKVKSFTEDFTVHDKKALRGYTGEFIHTYRKTGTFIFLVDPLFKALEEFYQTGKSDYFGQRGIDELKRGKLRFSDFYQCFGVKKAAEDMVKWKYKEPEFKELFIHGKNGKIRKVKPETMLRIIDEHTRRMDAIVRRIHEKYNPSRHFYAA